jgi:hypothetical protein
MSSASDARRTIGMARSVFIELMSKETGDEKETDNAN